MSLRKCWLAILVVTFAGSAVAQPEQAKKIRDALRRPTVGFSLNFGMNSDGGFSFGTPPQSPPPPVDGPALEALYGELRGTDADAEVLCRIAAVHDARGDADNARALRARAVPLFLRRLERSPRDVRCMGRLATALNQLGRPSEAERWLRWAVSVAPRDRDAWAALRTHLIAQGFVDLFGGEALTRAAAGGNAQDLMRRAAAERALDPDAVASARRRWKEAMDCLDWAILADPGDAKAFAERATLRLTVRAYLTALDAAAGVPVPEDALPRLLRGVRDDLRKAARLSPDDPHPWGLAVVAEAGELMNGPKPSDPGVRQASATGASSTRPGMIAAMDQLGPESRVFLAEAKDTLGRLTRHRDADTRMSAYTALALLNLFYQPDAASELLGRMPGEVFLRNDSLRGLMEAGLHDSARLGELLAFEKWMLRAADTAENRFRLAAVCSSAGDHLSAAGHCRAALRKDPDAVMPSLMLAFLLLKHGSDLDLPEVGRLLASAGRRLEELKAASDRDEQAGKTPDRGRERSAGQSLAALRAAHLALRGKRAEARAALNASLAGGDNPAAVDLLLALD